MTILIAVLAIYAGMIVIGLVTNGFGGKGLLPYLGGVVIGVGRFHWHLLLGAPKDWPAIQSQSQFRETDK